MPMCGVGDIDYKISYTWLLHTRIIYISTHIYAMHAHFDVRRRERQSMAAFKNSQLYCLLLRHLSLLYNIAEMYVWPVPRAYVGPPSLCISLYHIAALVEVTR